MSLIASGFFFLEVLPMGWLFTRQSRRELISDRVTSWTKTRDDGLTIQSTCMAYCLRGNVLWAVWERSFTKDGSPYQPSERWISCDLLARSNSGDGWGYNNMEECMHPYYYSCPLSYLEMVPLEQVGVNAEWRENVRSFHNRRKAKVTS